jgi:type II secretory pathway component GspD/PulD (secretin)
MRLVSGFLGLVLMSWLMGVSAWGQTPDTAANAVKPLGPREDTRPYQTFYLTNTGQQNDANEIVVAIRNLLDPSVKIYLVPSQNAILMRASPDQLAMAQKVINELDRPKKLYRLTYSITEMDSGKRIGVQHFAMVVAPGERTLMKQVSRVPVVTGSYNNGSTGNGGQGVESQVTYLDVGLIFDVTLSPYGNGGRLRSKVERSGVAEERSGVGPQDPVVRSTSLESTATLDVGKPLVVGSLDIPGSTRHLDVDVMMEVVAP